MKNYLLNLLLFFPICLVFSNTDKPTNIILTPTEVYGNANFKTTIKVDIGNDGSVEHTIIVNYQGYFHLTFPTPITATGGVYPDVAIWAEDSATPPVKSETILEKPLSSDELLKKIASGEKTLPTKVAPEPPKEVITKINPSLNEKQPKSTTYSYKVAIANTAFSLPIVRLNMIRGNTNFKTGDVTLFTSVGFGMSLNWGELTMTSDDASRIIDREFTNNFGIGLGFLYAAGSGEEPKNIFAINPFISLLDIQLGVGYELGTVVGNQSKFFFTATYAIPLQKLFKGKYYVYKASKGYNSDNVLDSEAKRDTDVYTFK